MLDGVPDAGILNGEDLAKEAVQTGKIRCIDLSYRGHFSAEGFRQEQWSAYLPESNQWVSSDVSLTHLARQVLDLLAAANDS